MGGSAPQAQGTTEQLVIDPKIMDQISANLPGLISGTNAFQGNANATAGQLNTDFSSFAPTLNTNFKGPNFSNSLDAFSRNLVSSGLQGIQNQSNAQQAQIRDQFGRSGAGAVLQRQTQAKSLLAGNNLGFLASADQRGRQEREFSLGQQAQSLGNQATLAQAQQGANAQAQGNAALAQKLGISQQALGAGQNLLAILTGLAATTGQRTVNPISSGPSQEELNAVIAADAAKKKAAEDFMRNQFGVGK